MKFTTVLSIALLTATVSAAALPNEPAWNSVAKRGDDIVTLDNAPVPADQDDDVLLDFENEEVTDEEIADVADDEEEFELDDEELEFLYSLDEAYGDDATALSIVALEARDIEARGVKAKILKLLLKKMTKSTLGKKVWNKIPKTKRKAIQKYVKAAQKKGKKKSKATKKWISTQVRPVVLSVLGGAIGTAAARIIVDDVVPWVVDVLLAIFL